MNTDTEKLFYIQSRERCWGGSAVWWCPNSAGYTGNLGRAGKYTESEARERVTDKDIAIPVAEVESMAHKTVDVSVANAFVRQFPEVCIRVHPCPSVVKK